MRITTRGRYALRAALALAMLEKRGAPVSINQIAEKEEISPVFLEQIFFKLRKAGIVSSARGPGGGFRFAKPLNKLTLKEIIDAAGEGLTLTPCDKRRDTCGRTGYCMAHRVWEEVAAMVNAYLQSLTIASIIEQWKDAGKQRPAKAGA